MADSFVESKTEGNNLMSTQVGFPGIQPELI